MPDFYAARNNAKQDIKNQYSVLDALKDFANLNMKGATWNGSTLSCKCPFHDDKTPSLSVYMDSGQYKCNAAGCDEGGDVFSAIMKGKNVDFAKALEMAAEKIGYELPSAKSFFRHPAAKYKPKPHNDRTVRRPISSGSASDNSSSSVTDNSQPPAQWSHDAAHIERERTYIPHDLEAFPAHAKLPDPHKKLWVWSPRKKRRDGQEGDRTSLTFVKAHTYRNTEGNPILHVLRGEKKVAADLRAQEASVKFQKIFDTPGLKGCFLACDCADMKKPVVGLEDLEVQLASGKFKLMIVDGKMNADAARIYFSEKGMDDWLVLHQQERMPDALRPDMANIMPAVKRVSQTIDRNFSEITGPLLFQSVVESKVFYQVRFSELPERADWLRTHGAKGMSFTSVESGMRVPVYGLEHAPGWLEGGGSKLLIVEGEKTTDAARRLLAKSGEGKDWLVLSPMSGANGAIRADFHELMMCIKSAGRDIEVHVWPDADLKKKKSDGTIVDPQVEYAKNIHKSITACNPEMEHIKSISRVRLPVGLPKGWDLADAEADMWEPAQVVMDIRDSSDRIYTGEVRGAENTPVAA